MAIPLRNPELYQRLCAASGGGALRFIDLDAKAN